MDVSQLYMLSATDGARLIRDGVISSEELVEACLDRVREVDGRIEAWAFLDPEHALAKARAGVEWRPGWRPPGAPSGIPGGVYGFKPTHGLIPRHGMFMISRTLDHVGLFARTIEDIALLASLLVGYDERDPDTRPRARIPFVEVAAEEPPLPPVFAFVKTARWDRVAGDAREAFAELTERLGDRVEEIELSSGVDAALDWHRTIMEVELAANLTREWNEGHARLSASIRPRIERGRATRALDYLAALAHLPELHEGFAELFSQRYDAILTPASTGTAPAGLDTTGDPAFCSLWTLCGMPAISVPLMQGENGLPLGLQMVGPRHGDARLLRTARWLVAHLAKG